MNFGPIRRLGIARACSLLFLLLTCTIIAGAQTCAVMVGTSGTATATVTIPVITGNTVTVTTSAGTNITFTSTYGFRLNNGVLVSILFVYTDPATGDHYEGEISFGGEEQAVGTLYITRAGVQTVYNLRLPAIRVAAIMFNHSPPAGPGPSNQGTSDGLDLRNAYPVTSGPKPVSNALNFQRPTTVGGLPVGFGNGKPAGEWALNLGAKYPANNEPALYVANNTVTIRAMFTGDNAILTSADLAATSTGGTIPNVLSRTVRFSPGTLPGGLTGVFSNVPSNPYVDFTLSQPTPAAIAKLMDSWRWTSSNINGCGNGPVRINQSGVHTFYNVLGTPTAPWYGSTAPNQQPWVTALDFAIVTANTAGITTIPAAASQITRFLHGGFGLTYDTVAGSPRYCSNNAITAVTFNLTGYMGKSAGATVNCYDQGSGAASLTDLLGGSARYRFMQPFGYINATTLVGGINTDNPFFRKTPMTNRLAGNVCAPARHPFGNHAFDDMTGSVYDATAGPYLGTTTIAQYITAAIDRGGLACHAAAAGTPASVRAAATITLR